MSRPGPRLVHVVLAGLVAGLLFVAVAAPAFAQSPGFGQFTCSGERKTHTSIVCSAEVQPGDLETHWRLEYSTAAGGPWTPVPGGSGVISQVEAEYYFVVGNVEAGKLVEAELAGLTPETTYYFRAVAENAGGKAEQEVHGEPVPLHPLPEMQAITNPTAVSAELFGTVNAEGFETDWRFEYAPAETNGQAPGEGSAAWVAVPGGSGTVSQALAEAEAGQTGRQGKAEVLAKLTGLAPSTVYYVRLFAEDEPGPGVHKHAISSIGQGSNTFGTDGPPAAGTMLLHALRGEGVVRALGTVQPNTSVTSEEQTVTIGGSPTGGTFKLTFAGQTTGATGTGDVFSTPASGTGDLSAARGFGVLTGGSNIVTGVNTVSGAFVVGQEIESEVLTGGQHPIPEGATITAVGAGTLGTVTLSVSANLTGLFPGQFPLIASSKTVSGLKTSTGSFAVGEAISGAGIPEGATIAAVGSGSLTLSADPTATGSGVALATNPRVVTGLSTSGVGESFVAGEAISGPGVPSGTTIVAADAHALTLSADPTAGGAGVALSADLAFDSPAETVTAALGKEVRGSPGGPFTVLFETASPGKAEPLIEASGAGLTPSGTVTVARTQAGGAGYDTHYDFEYVDQHDFESGGGFKSPETKLTPAVDLGLGERDNGRSKVESVGGDLPGLRAGETYRYRLTATNTTPGDPVVHGEERTLSAPEPAEVTPEVACPNAALRTGPSRSLPDCRAYEQVTPVEKGGAEEIFHAGTSKLENEGALIGEDGNHLVLNNVFVNWGSAGSSPYFFARTGEGWRMTPGTPQPEAGPDSYSPELYDPNLTRFAFSVNGLAGHGEQSSEVEFKLGPAGGPYTLAATVPRKLVQARHGEGGGWTAGSDDFSKLILKLEDHTLLGSSTHTSSGSDLYEYTEGGGLVQANVDSGGKTIGSCGASMVKGHEAFNFGFAEPLNGEVGAAGSRYSVSADGARVFFYAVPGSNCSEPPHLYMREAAAGKTVDIGEYEFEEANAAGSELLIAHHGELLRYDTETGVSEPVAPGVTLSGVRYSYSENRIPVWEFGYKHELGEEHNNDQVIRYDSVEHTVECISCASSFDPEPRHESFLFNRNVGSVSETRNGAPRETVASANGDFAFFDTINALVSQDVDGEVEPESEEAGHIPNPLTPSNDVYEWRRDGIYGCAHVQGCLSLISSGLGGSKNLVMLLGSAEDGRDVFFTTNSQLVAQDHDAALDIYDARIGGGFLPPPPAPTECEGDACSTPFAAPLDATPSSSTFQGAGNLPSEPLSTSPVKPKPKPKAKARCKTKAKKKCKTRAKRKTGKKARRAGAKQGARR